MRGDLHLIGIVPPLVLWGLVVEDSRSPELPVSVEGEQGGVGALQPVGHRVVFGVRRRDRVADRPADRRVLVHGSAERRLQKPRPFVHVGHDNGRVEKGIAAVGVKMGSDCYLIAVILVGVGRRLIVRRGIEIEIQIFPGTPYRSPEVVRVGSPQGIPGRRRFRAIGRLVYVQEPRVVLGGRYM